MNHEELLSNLGPEEFRTGCKLENQISIVGQTFHSPVFRLIFFIAGAKSHGFIVTSCDVVQELILPIRIL